MKFIVVKILLLILVYSEEKLKDMKCSFILYGLMEMVFSWLVICKELLISVL